MKLTPIDIQQQQFRTVLRGLDRRDVHAFLDMVAQQLGDLVRENVELRAELRQRARELDELKSREESLREAMLTAQRAIEDVRDQAQKEAQLIISEAELRAEKILHNAHSRVNRVVEEVNDLRRQRVRLVEELRGVINTHVRLLEMHDTQTQAGTLPEASVTVLDRLRAPTPPLASEAGGS